MAVDFKEYGKRMEKSLDHLAEEFGAVRAGRANAKVLDRITVEYYGSETALNGVATISSPDARTLVISPWDTKLLKDIQKAIQISDLGINPQNDGKVIRLVFPQLTEERRKELKKQVAKMGEDAKVALRNIRREANDKCKEMKKKSEMTEDEAKLLGYAYEQLGGAYRICVPDTAAATALIGKYPEVFRDYEIVKGKMDDVFLAVTGKKLTGGEEK